MELMKLKLRRLPKRIESLHIYSVIQGIDYRMYIFHKLTEICSRRFYWANFSIHLYTGLLDKIMAWPV